MSIGQLKKSFLAKVEAIGYVHHVNLVRVASFSSDKFRRLLVYGYMPNGSLDQWIFPKIKAFILDWRQRKKIIIDI